MVIANSIPIRPSTTATPIRRTYTCAECHRVFHWEALDAWVFSWDADVDWLLKQEHRKFKLRFRRVR